MTEVVRHLEERVRELERLLGRKTMEVQILKEGSGASLKAATLDRIRQPWFSKTDREA